MELYYSKKKILSSFLISLISLVALGLITLFIIDYANQIEDAEVLVVMAILFLFPAALVAGICLLRYTFLLLIPEKLMIRMDEQSILLNMNKASRKAGLIGWNEISGIIHSSDNMNKPAIRISLEGHINGVYQFYITKRDSKKMGLPLNELFDTIMTYYNTNKR